MTDDKYSYSVLPIELDIYADTFQEYAKNGNEFTIPLRAYNSISRKHDIAIVSIHPGERVST